MHLLQTFGEPQSLKPPYPLLGTDKAIDWPCDAQYWQYNKKTIGAVLLTFACVAILAHDMRPGESPDVFAQARLFEDAQ